MITNRVKAIAAVSIFLLFGAQAIFSQPLYDSLKADFSALPLGKKLTGPLFWVHGEADSTYKKWVDRMIHGGNGHFVFENRDQWSSLWLTPGWYDDVKVTLAYAKTKGMGAYIYDEKWWPSFDVGGKVPAEHKARKLACTIYPSAGSSTGTNLALGGTATASSFFGVGYEASKANDGDPATRWNSAGFQFNDQWLEIAWSSAKTFNAVTLTEGYAGRVQSFMIQYWNGTSWVNADSGTVIGTAKTCTFAPVTATKVRVYVKSSSNDPTFWEMGVYNDLTLTSVIIGPTLYTGSGFSGANYIKTVAGKVVNGTIDASSLIDLTSAISGGGALSWNVPEGSWKIFKFTWGYEGSGLLDMTTQSAVDWFIANVVKPHYDLTGAINILGFFFDEPEYRGSWGLGMEQDSPNWKQIMVSRFATLSGEDQGKATYEYWDALCERLGRVTYGTYQNFLRTKGGKLIGHFNEDDRFNCHPLDHGMGQINFMEAMKFQEMPGIDLVVGQMYPRQKTGRAFWIYQLPKLASSVAITNNQPDHLVMNEIFGGYGWSLTYQDRKWLGDQNQVHGANVLVPHAFNPKGSMSKPDGDFPPFYYYDGDEANWPKYKEWAERQNRLSYMLTGNDSANYSIAPVAFLWPGYSKYVDNTWNDNTCYPYNFQNALDRVHYDHQLLTYNRFESTATLNAATKQIELNKSRYKILVLPPVQYIQYATLYKAKQFYDNGGIVIAWQRVPSKSAKFGNTDAEIQSISTALWNSLTPATAATPIKTNANGGKTYFIAASDEATITTNLRSILANSGVNSDFRVMSGTFDEWTGYCHRKRNGMDVFLLWNGASSAATITTRFQVSGGTPELWNPTTNAIAPLTATTVSTNEVDVALTIPAEESYLVVFKAPSVSVKPEKRNTDINQLMFKGNLPGLVSRTTAITYSVNTAQHVSLSLYSAAGRKIATLADGVHAPGVYSRSVAVDGLSNGIYFLELKSHERAIRKPFTILKH